MFKAMFVAFAVSIVGAAVGMTMQFALGIMHPAAYFVLGACTGMVSMVLLSKR